MFLFAIKRDSVATAVLFWRIKFAIKQTESELSQKLRIKSLLCSGNSLAKS